MTYERVCDKCGALWRCNGCNARTSNKCYCEYCLGTVADKVAIKNCFPEVKEMVIFT